MKFLKLTDAITSLPILIRADLIFKIERSCDNRATIITFIEESATEYVQETLEQIETLIRHNLVD